MGRARRGSIEIHGERQRYGTDDKGRPKYRPANDGKSHYDVRWTLNDGTRSAPVCLPVGTSEEMAREKALYHTERARAADETRPAAAAPGAPKSDTIADLGAKWLDLVDASSLAPATKKGHRSNFAIRVEPKLGTHTIATLTTGVVRQWIRDIRVGLSASKTRDTFNTLAKMLDECAAEDWIDFDVSPCRHPKVRAELPTVEAPEDEDVQTLAERDVSTMLRTMAPPVMWLREIVAATSGMRDEEIAGLKWSRLVDAFGVRVYRVKDVVAIYGEDGWATTKATKTRDSRRSIPVHPAVLPWLDAWRATGWREYVGREPTDEDYVFPSPTGEAWRPRSAELLRAHLEAADLPTADAHGRAFNFKCLRASFNSWLHAHGVDLEARQRLMGHTRASVNERNYTATDYAGMLRAVSTIAIDLGSPGGSDSARKAPDERADAEKLSHLRDLNSRPTVYESTLPIAIGTVSAGIGADPTIAPPSTTGGNVATPRPSAENSASARDAFVAALTTQIATLAAAGEMDAARLAHELLGRLLAAPPPPANVTPIGAAKRR